MRGTRPFSGKMLIGGKLVESIDGKWLDSINPADETELGRVPLGSARDMDMAVEAAVQAFPARAGLSVAKRAEYVHALADAILVKKEEVANIESLDTGKANAIDLGLTGAVWTQDIMRALRVAQSIQAGYIWVNGVGTHFTGVPFGGLGLKVGARVKAYPVREAGGLLFAYMGPAPIPEFPMWEPYMDRLEIGRPNIANICHRLPQSDDLGNRSIVRCLTMYQLEYNDSGSYNNTSDRNTASAISKIGGYNPCSYRTSDILLRLLASSTLPARQGSAMSRSPPFL